VYRAFYAERSKTSTRFTIRGRSGHGSQFLEDTVGEKLRRLLDTVYDMREAERQRRDGPNDGHLTAINLTMLQGGVQNNVV
jgi:aminoacylase